MSHEEIVLRVIRALEDAQIPYMLVGSFSSSAYGIPRTTRDLDVVVQLGDVSIRSIADRLEPDLKLDPQMSFESVTMTIRHIFEARESGFKVELFHLGDDPHDQERFRRRKRLPLAGVSAFVASAEDVIITKLNWLFRNPRGKDRDDIRDVLAVQGDALDFDYIHSWCDRHGTRSLLDEIRASIPKID